MKENDLSDRRTSVNTQELAQIVRHQVDLLHKKPSLAEKIPPLMVWGAPGIGKSAIMRQVAAEEGIGFIDIRLSQREPVDLRGLPVPDAQEKRVEWFLSSDWPRDADSRGILLFDELTAADRMLQVAAYEIILDRRLGDLYTVPSGWYIVGAGNRLEDMAVSTCMSSALANRFMHVELREDVESWCRWGLTHGIEPCVLAFIRFRPELLFSMEDENLERGWPSPRSWERVSTLLKTAGETDESVIARLVYGLVGIAAGAEFLAYRELVSPYEDVRDKMLDASQELVIPRKADERYAFCTAVAYYVWRGKDEAEAAALLDGFYRVIEMLPGDFAAMLMMDALNGNELISKTEAASRLFHHPLYSDWRRRNSAAIKSTLC